MWISIDDPADARLDDYRALKEADLVGKQGRFIAEGSKVVQLWAHSGKFRFRSVLLGENRAESMRSALSHVAAPIYVAPQPVLDAIVGFHIHRGCLAAGERGALPSIAEVLRGAPPQALVLVGIGIANHDNVGALFRNAAALGAHAVLLDESSADPLYRKAIRVSMGHALTTPTSARVPALELSAALAAAGFQRWALTPHPLARELGAIDAVPDRVALMLGSEGEGLSAEVLADVDERVRIPMADGVDSLNVATAAAIATFAITSARARPTR